MRRTKQEALATRTAILDAAEEAFHEHGVAHTTLSDIARVAGVTRGAIYWHFDNKIALFRALNERVLLPQEALFLRRGLGASQKDGLAFLYATSVEVIANFIADPRAQRVFKIMLFRCEYVGEMEEALVLRRKGEESMRHAILGVFQQAADARELNSAWPVEAAASAYCCAMSGLFSEWLKSDGGYDLACVGERMLSSLFASFSDAGGCVDRAQSSVARPPEAETEESS